MVVGFATLRRCRDGGKVGPLVAATALDGLRLAQAALAALPVKAGPVMLDLPEANRSLALRLTALGFANSLTTRPDVSRPAPGGGPDGPGDCVYGVGVRGGGCDCSQTGGH